MATDSYRIPTKSFHQEKAIYLYRVTKLVQFRILEAMVVRKQASYRTLGKLLPASSNDCFGSTIKATPPPSESYQPFFPFHSKRGSSVPLLPSSLAKTRKSHAKDTISRVHNRDGHGFCYPRQDCRIGVLIRLAGRGQWWEREELRVGAWVRG